MKQDFDLKAFKHWLENRVGLVDYEQVLIRFEIARKKEVSKINDSLHVLHDSQKEGPPDRIKHLEHYWTIQGEIKQLKKINIDVFGADLRSYG